MVGRLVRRLHSHSGRLVGPRRLHHVHQLGAGSSLGSLGLRRPIERRSPALEGLVHGQGGRTEVKHRDLRGRTARLHRRHTVLRQAHGTRRRHLRPSLRQRPSHGGILPSRRLPNGSPGPLHRRRGGGHRRGHPVHEHHRRFPRAVGPKQGRVVEPRIDGRIGVAADHNRRRNEDEARGTKAADLRQESARRRVGHAIPRRGTH